MTLIIILGAVFLGVMLMVILGEKYGTPMEPEQQEKYSKITRFLVFGLIILAIIKGLVG
ncbi:hypothetical protein [Thalassotalea profundi]|uniref:HIG1 domain-containing protein n=1 Tax=Thalassotalea profundi TaxID=2036687 RepID=A0ABQ3IH84_9GAMM|nr:hypothetical protein [Thalassotalea profundi]GHE79937.1 hypothetical protein GCM10011501_04660 [Thalassotalea profundi]